MTEQTIAEEKPKRKPAARKPKQKAPESPQEAVAKPGQCTDSRCPFHGKLSIRGRTLVGVITSTKMRRTAKFELETRHSIPKYERYENRKTVLKVHNPDCIAAKEGDKVKISECRPISKTKSFVIIQKL